MGHAGRLGAALTYLALTFGISWDMVWLAIGSDGFPGAPKEFDRLLLPVVLAMLGGPSVAGLLSLGVLHGRAGLRDFRSRLLAWRVGARWYALALLTAPLVVATSLLTLGWRSSVFIPGVATADQPLAHLLTGLATGIGAGLFEEIGWTGFAIPELRRRFSVFAAGLLLGILWGAWHLLPTWWGSSESAGGVPLGIYLPVMVFSFLVPYRILMVWVHEHTNSVLVAMLMHASLTASVRIFDPLTIAGWPLIAYNLVLGGAFWGVVAVLVIATHRRWETVAAVPSRQATSSRRDAPAASSP